MRKQRSVFVSDNELRPWSPHKKKSKKYIAHLITWGLHKLQVPVTIDRDPKRKGYKITVNDRTEWEPVLITDVQYTILKATKVSKEEYYDE